MHEELEQDEEEWDSAQQMEEDQQPIIGIDNPIPMETITLTPKKRGRKRSRDQGQTSESNMEENDAPLHHETVTDNSRLMTHDVHRNHLSKPLLTLARDHDIRHLDNTIVEQDSSNDIMEGQDPSRARKRSHHDVTNEHSQHTSLESRETQNTTNQMDIVPTELQHTENIAADGLTITANEQVRDNALVETPIHSASGANIHQHHNSEDDQNSEIEENNADQPTTKGAKGTAYNS